MEGHWQCFWNSPNPMPVFFQSVARQVDLNLSKIHTPSSVSSMIIDFDSSKSLLSFLCQELLIHANSLAAIFV